MTLPRDTTGYDLSGESDEDLRFQIRGYQVLMDDFVRGVGWIHPAIFYCYKARLAELKWRTIEREAVGDVT